MLETIVGLLESQGHRVTATKNGAEAVAAYASKQRASEPYDLIIVDLTVTGGMGGKEAAEKILECDPAARLVVSSGYSAGAEMAKFRELGFKARLEKPFRIGELKSAISEAMR